MDHPGLVGGLQRRGDLFRYRESFVNWDRALGDTVGQGRPFDQLQDERTAPFDCVFFNAVDGGDAGMVEAGEDLRLPLEPGEAIRVSREGAGENPSALEVMSSCRSAYAKKARAAHRNSASGVPVASTSPVSTVTARKVEFAPTYTGSPPFGDRS